MKEKGFTLVELLVVISIITALSAIAIVVFTNINKNARDAKRQSDLKTIQSGLEQYHADQGVYPATLPAVGNSLTDGGSRIYLNKIPGDPIGSQPYLYRALPAGCTTACSSYCLYGKMENTSSLLSICADQSGYNYEVSAP